MTSPGTHDVTLHLECMTSCITSRHRKYTGAGNFGTGAGSKIEGEEAKNRLESSSGPESRSYPTFGPSAAKNNSKTEQIVSRCGDRGPASIALGTTSWSREQPPSGVAKIRFRDPVPQSF